MQIEDFTFVSSHIVGPHWQTILTNKLGTKFGCIYQAGAAAPNEVIFVEFNKNPKNFFIDVEFEIIKEVVEITA